MVEGDAVDVRGDVLNGAEVRGRDVSAVDVSGLRRTERDDVWLYARITAADNVTLRHCHGPAHVRGRTIDVCNVRDGCILEARNLTVRGYTVTHDCTMKVSESLTFSARHVLGLSDDCVVLWGGGFNSGGGAVSLGRLKTYKINHLPGFGGVPGTMVGSGFTITVEMLKHVAASRCLSPFGTDH